MTATNIANTITGTTTAGTTAAARFCGDPSAFTAVDAAAVVIEVDSVVITLMVEVEVGEKLVLDVEAAIVILNETLEEIALVVLEVLAMVAVIVIVVGVSVVPFPKEVAFVSFVDVSFILSATCEVLSVD